jgi:hypothetical protein
VRVLRDRSVVVEGLFGEVFAENCEDFVPSGRESAPDEALVLDVWKSESSDVKERDIDS